MPALAALLGRSYTVLERYPEALAAYQTLLKLRVVPVVSTTQMSRLRDGDA